MSTLGKFSGGGISFISFLNLYEIEDQVYIVTMGDSFIQKDDSILESIHAEHSTNHLKGVVLDLEKISCLNSAGVGKIMLLVKELINDQIPLVLCHVSQKNQKIFKLTQLDQHLTIYSTALEAKSSFK